MDLFTRFSSFVFDSHEIGEIQHGELGMLLIIATDIIKNGNARRVELSQYSISDRLTITRKTIHKWSIALVNYGLLGYESGRGTRCTQYWIPWLAQFPSVDECLMTFRQHAVKWSATPNGKLDTDHATQQNILNQYEFLGNDKTSILASIARIAERIDGDSKYTEQFNGMELSWLFDGGRKWQWLLNRNQGKRNKQQDTRQAYQPQASPFRGMPQTRFQYEQALKMAGSKDSFAEERAHIEQIKEAQRQQEENSQA